MAKVIAKASKASTKANEPVTKKGSFFNLSEDTKRKLKFVAGADEDLNDQTKVVNEALERFFEQWQKETGIKIPASKKN